MKCECENTGCIHSQKPDPECPRFAIEGLKTVYGTTLCGECADQHPAECLRLGKSAIKAVQSVSGVFLAADGSRDLEDLIHLQIVDETPWRGHLEKLHPLACFALMIDLPKEHPESASTRVITLFEEDLHVIDTIVMEG